MKVYEVKMGRPGGSGTFVVRVPASTPDETRYLAWNKENADYIAEYNAEVERDGMSFPEWRRV